MENLSVKVYVPSYKRSDNILTQNLFEDCTYVVRKSEKGNYTNAGVKDIWTVEDELIDGGAKAFFYIVENAPEAILKKQ